MRRERIVLDGGQTNRREEATEHARCGDFGAGKPKGPVRGLREDAGCCRRNVEQFDLDEVFLLGFFVRHFAGFSNVQRGMRRNEGK